MRTHLLTLTYLFLAYLSWGWFGRPGTVTTALKEEVFPPRPLRAAPAQSVTVNGINLGMTTKQVSQVLGEPWPLDLDCKHDRPDWNLKKIQIRIGKEKDKELYPQDYPAMVGQVVCVNATQVESEGLVILRLYHVLPYTWLEALLGTPSDLLPNDNHDAESGWSNRDSYCLRYAQLDDLELELRGEHDHSPQDPVGFLRTQRVWITRIGKATPKCGRWIFASGCLHPKAPEGTSEGDGRERGESR